MAIYNGCGCPATPSAAFCNDDACGGSFQSETSFDVTGGQDYLIRVGGFAGAEGSGTLVISRRLEACCFPDGPCQELNLNDCIAAGGASAGEGTDCAATMCPPVRPETDVILSVGGAVVASAKNRFITFSGGDSGRAQAVRITFVSLPAPFDAWNGLKMFVQEPFDAAENPGKVLRDPILLGDATFRAASLGCDPVYFDWSAIGDVHVFSQTIVPSKLVTGGGAIGVPAVYDIQFIDIPGSPNVEDDFGPQLSVTTAGWADLAGLAAGEFRAPDRTISVTDILAMLSAFAAKPGAPIKVRAELMGTTNGGSAFVDGVISVVDLLAVLHAFSGDQYPLTPGPSPCD